MNPLMISTTLPNSSVMYWHLSHAIPLFTLTFELERDLETSPLELFRLLYALVFFRRALLIC